MAMESEDAIKRQTDCVYFLASPLTCKKGSECEFRHSEIARLNPRDCFYWLNGSCLNPTCAFRHPPLEGYTEITSDAAHPTLYTSVPPTKSYVPCYFYYNEFCIKGDQCPFMHDALTAQRFPKPASDTSTAHPIENKTSTGSDTGPASVEMPASTSEGPLEVIKQSNSQEVLGQPNPGNIIEELSPSAESSVPECEEPAIKSPQNPLPPLEYVNSTAQLSSDQSSEELVKECTEPDEWLESSPGFDVLVDDGSEQYAYEDDPDYLLTRERESERLHNHLFQHDFEDSSGFDPLNYPDVGFLYDHSIYDSYDRIDDRHTPEYFHRIPEIPRERMLEPMFHRKRRLPRGERRLDVRDGADLRDHLRKRRRLDASQVSRSSRRRHSSQIKGRSRERPLKPLPHGWLASEVGRNMILSSHSESESGLNDWHRQSRSRYSQSGRHAQPRRRDRGSRRHGRALPALSSEILKDPDQNEMRSAQQATAGFTGPKTLAQIKEERNRAKEDGNGSQFPRRTVTNDFKGPKPLSDLLKEKKRPLVPSDGTNGLVDTISKQEPLQDIHSQTNNGGCNTAIGGGNGMFCPGMGENQDREYESDFSDDDEDDGLRKKLAHILER